MVTAAEQDIILKNNDGKIDEILVMKVVLESLNFTLDFENTSSDAYDELHEGLINAVSIFGVKIQIRKKLKNSIFGAKIPNKKLELI